MMFKWISNITLCSNSSRIQFGIVRNYSKMGWFSALKTLFSSDIGRFAPPYHHVCQVGDPALRLRANPVHPEVIPTAEFKKIVNHLIKMMREYNAFGLSAPQIGLPMQIFVIETTRENYAAWLKQRWGGQPIEVIPLYIFINPKMKILDYETFTYPETCSSMCGYSACVTRARTVRIEAVNLLGKTFVWEASGWPAKLAQHEMDHLEGILFTDRMDPKTLSCVAWDKVNRKGGNVAINMLPRSRTRLKRIFYL